MSQSFANVKKLRYTITLAVGTFANGQDTVVIEGFRSSVDIQKTGGNMMCSCTARIWGLDKDLMSRLTTLAFLALQFYNKNFVKVEAIDGDMVSLVYSGQIINAWGDYQSAPDVSLYIETQTGFSDQLNIATPLTYDGTIDVTTLMQKLAERMDLSFSNNGVTAKISKPAYHGSLIDQLRNLANDTKTEFYLEENTLSICPKGSNRQFNDNLVPLVSSQSGLIGYPTFDKLGIMFKCLFNPSIRFGALMVMQSDIAQANGTWKVSSINHYLESEMPNGQWFSTIQCTASGVTPL